MKQLRVAPPDACLWEETLAFNAVCVSILNSCIIPQLESPAMRQLLRRVAYYNVPEANTAEEAEWGYNSGHLEPWIEKRGAYFVADAAKNLFPDMPGSYIYRVSIRVQFDEDMLVAVYQQESMSHLRSKFGLGSHGTKLIRSNGLTNRRLYKGGSTILADAMSRRPRATALVFNNIGALNIEVAQPAKRTGQDAREQDVVGYSKVDEMLQGSVVDILNRLYRQLAHDIMAKSPNKHKAGSYTTLRPAEIAAVTQEVYLHPILPFTCARVVLCQENIWDAVVANLFPPKGKMAAANATGYPTSTYFQAWTVFLNRLDEWDAARVTAEMRSEVAKLLWLPRTNKGSMWITRKEPMESSIVLPAETYEPCPLIAANPRYIRGLDNLNRFILRE